MNYFAMISYIAVSMITPGPNTIMSMEEGKNVGFPRVYFFIGGIVAGFFITGLACAVVTSLLLDLLPDIGFYLKALGSAYILYLALKALRANPTLEKDNAAFSGKAAFITGLTLQLVNVKALMMLLTALSVYLFPATGDPLHILLFVLCICAASGVSCSLWAGFGSLFRRLFASHGKIINAVIALLLVYCAVGIWL